LPEGITLDQLREPHPSVPRNPLIVHIFYLAGLIEEMGFGTGRIIETLSGFMCLGNFVFEKRDSIPV